MSPRRTKEQLDQAHRNAGDKATTRTHRGPSRGGGNPYRTYSSCRCDRPWFDRLEGSCVKCGKQWIGPTTEGAP